VSSEIAATIREFIAETFQFRGSIAGLPDDASLIKAGIFDSVGILTLVSFLEERFEIKISDDEVEPENLDSVASITALVMRKTQPGN
jgi:acyl carrier protein